MPRIARVKVPTPVSVSRAAAVFGSELRIQLTRYYLRHPGPQREAASALGLTGTVTSVNTNALVEAGVLTVTPSEDGRWSNYSVDTTQLQSLLSALAEFLEPDQDS